MTARRWSIAARLRGINSENYEVIAMHQFSARDFMIADFLRWKCHHAARELQTVAVANADDVAGIELAFAACHARGQQAFAVFDEGTSRSGIDVQRTLRMVEKRNPTLASAQ